MRTADQIEELTKHKTKPYQQLNYLDKTTTENLIKLFKYAPKIVNSGRLQHIDIKKIGITNNICDRLKRDFGDFKVRAATIWEATKPHNIHNNDSIKSDKPGLAFVFPLFHEGGIDIDARLCFFDQYYYHGAGKFFKGEKNQKEFFNKTISDYKDISYKNDKGIPKDFKEKYMSHWKDRWLDELSLQDSFPWAIGSVMKFDVCQLHGASDFRKVGIKRKIGMAIFTDMV